MSFIGWIRRTSVSHAHDDVELAQIEDTPPAKARRASINDQRIENGGEWRLLGLVLY